MILVTGGFGYLGSALVKQLLAEGESVRVLCRSPNPSFENVCVGDILCPEQIDAAMKGVEVVYHLAALVDHYATAEQLRQTNVQGTLNVVDSALRHGVKRVVYCSSVSAEIGGGSTDYGRSKIEAEQALEPYHSQIPIIILRPGPIYDEKRKNLQRLICLARLTHISPQLLPDVKVHLASLQNVVTAFCLARKLGKAGSAYVVCDLFPVRRSVLTSIIQHETSAIGLPISSKILLPLLRVLAYLFEYLHSVFKIRPLIDRHYLKVLTRERQYQMASTIADLGYQPATTEAHFTNTVRAYLSR